MQPMKERRKIGQSKQNNTSANEVWGTPHPDQPLQSSGLDTPARPRTVSPDGTSRATQDTTGSERPKCEKKVTPTGLQKPEIVRPTGETKSWQPQAQSPEAQIARDPQATEEAHGSGWEAGPARRPRWEDRYTRVTWYVENQRLHRVREQSWRTGRSLTIIVNDALEQYLKSRHH